MANDLNTRGRLVDLTRLLVDDLNRLPMLGVQGLSHLICNCWRHKPIVEPDRVGKIETLKRVRSRL